MHGCNSRPAPLVNAEVDSMGGIVDGGVGIGLKTSSHRAAIEKAQAELRHEYDVREERRRELEFLEKDGNPLDFKFGNAASVSVQSTSVTDQHHEQFVTSEAKGSFALAASPHGDSVDSSARPRAPSISEPNTADNLLLFDNESELPEDKRGSLQSHRKNYFAPSEQSSQVDGSQNAKESEDSAIFRPYARRNRSRPNHGPRGGSRDGKGSMSETKNRKDHNLPSMSKPKSAGLNGDMVTKDLTSNIPLDNELDGVQAYQTASGCTSVLAENLNIPINRSFKEDKCTLLSQDDVVLNSVVRASGVATVVEAREPTVSADLEPLPFANNTKQDKEICSGQPNGFGNIKVTRKSVLGMKNVDSESSCTQTSLGRDVNNGSDMCTNINNMDANGGTMEQTAEFEKKLDLTSELVKERSKTSTGESGATASYDHGAVRQNHGGSINMVKAEEDMHINRQNKVNDSCNSLGEQHNVNTRSKIDKESDVLVDHGYSIKENSCDRYQSPKDVLISELSQIALAEKITTAASDGRICRNLKLADKANEDSILEEARTIEAKRKRIAELSVRTLPSESHRRSHWGFVLEEMEWLANDFAQERLWKTTAAAQLCHRAAFTSRLRFEKQNKHWGLKYLAHSMAKAVMQFWQSVELLVGNDDLGFNYVDASFESGKVDANEASSNKRRNSNMETCEDLEGQHPRRIVALKLQAYALRFLKCNGSHGISSQTDALATPDRISDSGNVDMSWQELLTEENLFYTVPPMAIDAYRKTVESLFLQFEKIESGIQEEVGTSLYDTAAEFGSEEIAYDEDEGETSTYYLHGVYEGSKSSKSAQKKHKNMIYSYAPRSSEAGADSPYVHYNQPSMQIGRKPASLNVGPVPTKRKRKRMASRQRVVSPFMVTGTMQAEAKTDASSGDTNSFQDDQSTLHGGSQIQKSLEVESVGDFEKQLPYDYAEISVKSKKAKNLASAYDQRWQLNSVVLNDQRDLSKKRLDSRHFESNGRSGLYRQHNAKKPKITKQSFDNSFDNINPMANSIPSPAASQMSNMSNLSKSIKFISGRDGGRKPKMLKISAGQQGSGGPWSSFEDQVLVVLVHDMGPNWELISDAINSTLQFKCIFRKPKECKDRHKILMDRSAGDGADSAEDSGSSQSYPSTLPGIPKGSARQLFQHLQGPMEEDTIKSHFEKIIKIGKKQHYQRNQNDNEDLKQITPVHNSHVTVLSDVRPNNLNGGLLTPLDLCDVNAPAPEALALGYQDSNAGGLLLSNQGSVPSVLPTSGANPSLPGSSGMVIGNNLSSPFGPATSIRYGVPRTSPLSVDEQRRIQQYNQMLSGRNVQQSSVSVPGSLSGSDHGIRMLPGGNSMGMIGGTNRSMAMSRPAFQGMATSSMMSSGSILSSNMVGIPSPVNMHSGVSSGQGNSVLRPHETLPMMRPGHNPEHRRQTVVPELQMQVTQGSSQGIPAFSGLSSAFNNQTSPPPLQPYPGQAQQQSHLSSPHSHLQSPNHANSQQQAYAIRLAKERQLQHQRYLQHQQQKQQFAASNALMPHVQVQSQLPMSSSLQNSSQVQSQNSSQQVSLPPVTPSTPLTPMSSQHQQQKQHQPQPGFSRNPGASMLNNQAVKQRQRHPQQQQYQQPGRQHPNQRQHMQSQQHAKVLKGVGRGNMLVEQSISVDSSHLNGLSVPLGSQTAEKADQITHNIQGQNLHPVSGLNPIQPSKPLGPSHSSNHSQLQQNPHLGPTTFSPTTSSTKQLQPAVSPSDISAQGQVPPVPAAALSSNNPQPQQQSQPQSKKINQTQSNIQRMLQQKQLVHSESSSKPQSDSTLVDQLPVNNASEISTSTALTPDCIDSSSVVPVIPTISSQWRTSEPLLDSNISNVATQGSSLGNAPIGNSVKSEPLPTISQGMGPRQLSFSLPSHIHNSGAQWQQRPLSIQQSSSQAILSQQPYQPQEQRQQEQEQSSPKHVLLQHQPQRQLQHLQPGQNSLFICPNSKGE